MKRNKKNNLILLFVVVMLIMGVGYAYLNADLSINGTANISSSSWNVYWNNVQIDSRSVTDVTTPARIKSGNTEVEFNVNLNEPGDFYEFTVDAVNDGSIDAMIGDLTTGVYAANGTTQKPLPDYLEYTVKYVDDIVIEENHILAAGTTETYKVRVKYKDDISASQLPSTDDHYVFKFGINYAQKNENAISARFMCEAGKYLPKGTTKCTDCKAGNYCLESTYPFNDSIDQGLIKCAQGSTSSSGANSCNACNKGTTTTEPGKSYCSYCRNWNGAETWETPVWNTNNTVTNSCIITSCKTPPQGTMVFGDNECLFTGSLYSYTSTSIGEDENVGPYANSDYVRSNKSCSRHMYIKLQVDNNIVKKEYLCFTIGGSGIYIPNLNSGEYCFESPGTNSLENTYQRNVSTLKSVFGENDSRCEETDESYICGGSINSGRYEFAIYKNGDCSIDYDDDDTEPYYIENYCMENPYCYINNRRAACPNKGCLDGETEVEVYDRKKKKRKRKKFKDVTPDDLILCWDFDLGEFVFVEPLWIKQVETMERYYLLKFSDGSLLKIIGDHKIFDVDRGKFVNAGCDNELEIGAHVYNSKGEIVELISWEVINEEIDSYNIITDYHMNIFANGILTSCVFSNIYPVENMKYVKENKETISLEDLDEIDEKFIKGLRLNEVPSDFRGNKKSTISYIKEYIENLISKEK